MNMSEITNAILSMNGACMGRVNKSNFIIVPTEDGGYVKVNVTAALSKDTKNHKAFNYDAAVAEYKVWETQNALKAAERAAKPPKEKGPNPEAQARRDALDAAIEALPAFGHWTATDIMNALSGYVGTVMAVGSAAKRLVEKGVLTSEVEDKKSYYTKA